MSTAPPLALDGVGALAELVGQPLGTSAWHRIDQAAIDDFARLTDDHQWIHFDPERAAQGPFGTTMAHGYLTLSLCSHFLAESFQVRGTLMALNYGLDRVRFPAPVPVGSSVRGRCTLSSLTPVPAGADAVVRVTIETERGAKPCCVADVVIRYVTET